MGQRVLITTLQWQPTVRSGRPDLFLDSPPLGYGLGGGSNSSCLCFLQSLWLCCLWFGAPRFRGLFATALFWTFAVAKKKWSYLLASWLSLVTLAFSRSSQVFKEQSSLQFEDSSVVYQKSQGQSRVLNILISMQMTDIIGVYTAHALHTELNFYSK